MPSLPENVFPKCVAYFSSLHEEKDRENLARVL